MAYEDAGHRPHANHKGETPENPISEGPESISVTLDTWGPQEGLFTTIYDALQSNWGEEPNRSGDQSIRPEYRDDSKLYQIFNQDDIDVKTGWARLTDGQREYVESCFQGKTLNQILELLTFEFTINGISRACTHQLVRTRIGAAFMQHGGRDNDWRHRSWTMPETIRRACVADEEFDRRDVPDGSPLVLGLVEGDKKHCIKDWEPIEQLLSERADHMGDPSLRNVIFDYLAQGRALYAALVDAGIPWQDARRVLWMGTQTYIHAVYNFVALQGVASKRLEFAMDWEINCVAQLMVREVRTKCHPLIGKYLQSISDKLGVAAFAGLESWTPSGKHDNPFEVCKVCGKKKNEPHTKDEAGFDFPHEFKGVDTRPRTHIPEQSPFWILHPDSMAGGPVRWIATNGVFPSEFK